MTHAVDAGLFNASSLYAKANIDPALEAEFHNLIVRAHDEVQTQTRRADSPDGAIVLAQAGGRDRDYCIEECTELVYGSNRFPPSQRRDEFDRCVSHCMGRDDWPHWRPYFPRESNEPRPVFPVPPLILPRVGNGGGGCIMPQNCNIIPRY